MKVKTVVRVQRKTRITPAYKLKNIAPRFSSSMSAKSALEKKLRRSIHGTKSPSACKHVPTNNLVRQHVLVFHYNPKVLKSHT